MDDRSGGAERAAAPRLDQEVAAGTEIVVEGYQAKDGSNRANGSLITFPDGRKLFVGSSKGDAGAAPDAK